MRYYFSFLSRLLVRSFIWLLMTGFTLGACVGSLNASKPKLSDVPKLKPPAATSSSCTAPPETYGQLPKVHCGALTDGGLFCAYAFEFFSGKAHWACVMMLEQHECNAEYKEAWIQCSPIEAKKIDT
jgi:hypothetical protein